MCVDYEPCAEDEIWSTFQASWANELVMPKWGVEAWQDYPAPIIRRGAKGGRNVAVGTYGMVPKRHLPDGVRFSTMNARSETVGQKTSFAKAWRNLQLCLVPMQSFFEPSWETGKAERWRIKMADSKPFAVAGLWRDWMEPDGGTATSFTQLTINADEHPLMSRFHRPDDEKRALVIVPPDEYDTWLNCRDPELARSFMKGYPAELMASEPAPLVRASKTSVKATRPSTLPLFD